MFARGDSAGYRLAQFARRNRGFVTGFSLFILALMAALIVTLGFYRNARESAARARWYAYTSTLAAAESAIMNHNMKEAGELMATIGGEFQGWEYRHLKARLDRSQESWKAHDGGITRLRFSGDGTRILTTGTDRAARLWRADSRDSLAGWVFKGEVESGDFLSGENRIAVGLTNGRVMTAKAGVPEPESLGRGSAYAIIDVHPDGNIVAAGFENGEVALFDAAARRETHRWKAHHRLALPVFSPDGTLLATCGSDSVIRVWTLADRRLRKTLHGHRHRIFAMAFSPDGRRIVSGSRDRTATVWDLETGAAISSFSEHRGTPAPVAFHPGGTTVISAGSEGRVIVWDPATGARVAEFHGHRADVSALDVSPDGKRIATGEWDGSIRFWKDGTDDVRMMTLPRSGDIHPFTDLDIEPTGTLVAAVAGSAYLPSRRIVVDRIGVGTMSFCNQGGIISIAIADSGLILAGSNLGTVYRMGDVPPAWVDTTVAHAGGVVCLAVDRSEERVASGGEDGFIRVWTLPGFRPIHELKGHAGPVRDLEIDTRGRVLASGGEDGVIRLWNVTTGDSLGAFRLAGSAVTDLAIHPDGERLAFTTSTGLAGLLDLRSWSISDTLFAAGGGASAVTFSPDGKRVVVGSMDTLVYILDADRGTPIMRLHGHLSRVAAVMFTPDGNTLLSGSHDGTIRVWDAARKIDDLYQ